MRAGTGFLWEQVKAGDSGAIPPHTTDGREEGEGLRAWQGRAVSSPGDCASHARCGSGKLRAEIPSPGLPAAPEFVTLPDCSKSLRGSHLSSLRVQLPLPLLPDHHPNTSSPQSKQPDIGVLTGILAQRSSWPVITVSISCLCACCPSASPCCPTRAVGAHLSCSALSSGLWTVPSLPRLLSGHTRVRRCLPGSLLAHKFCTSAAGRPYASPWSPAKHPSRGKEQRVYLPFCASVLLSRPPF